VPGAGIGDVRPEEFVATGRSDGPVRRSAACSPYHERFIEAFMAWLAASCGDGERGIVRPAG